jgi:hypothetical protein
LRAWKNYLDVKVETMSYHNIPPPYFWAMMAPQIWDQFLIIQIDYQLEEVYLEQQGVGCVSSLTFQQKKI